ncbi:MAG: ABC transporter permease [Synergistaceae bacterium]|nr:ABC transporter permease [Synergistaceae bacterium]
MKRFIESAAVVVVLLVLWHFARQSGRWTEYILPGPLRVWNTFWDMAGDGSLLKHTLSSLARVFYGFSAAFILAFVLGTLAGVFPRSASFYSPIVEFLRNVPPMSLIPLLILWFGIGERSKIIFIVLTSFFPMFLSIQKGFASCDIKLLEVGSAFSFSRWQRFRRIMLPAAVPDILVGMRVGLGFSWRAIIGAEMIAAAGGLGYMILHAQQISRSDRVIVGIFVIGTVGCLCNWLFSFAMKRLTWGGVNDSWS